MKNKGMYSMTVIMAVGIGVCQEGGRESKQNQAIQQADMLSLVRIFLLGKAQTRESAADKD